MTSSSRTNYLVYDFLMRHGHANIAKELEKQCYLNYAENVSLDYTLEQVYKNYLKKSSQIFTQCVKPLSSYETGEPLHTNQDLISVREAFREHEIVKDPTDLIDKLTIEIWKINPMIQKIQMKNSSTNYRLQLQSEKLDSGFSTTLLKFGEKEEIERQFKSFRLNFSEEQTVLQIFEPIGNKKILESSEYWKIHLIGSYLGRNLECNRHWTHIIRSLVLNRYKPDLPNDLPTLIELVPFKSEFREQTRFFTPDPNSVLDLAVSYLLLEHKDIKTHKLNKLVGLYEIRELRKSVPQIYHRRYTTCKGGEEETIRERINELIERSRIPDIRKFHEEIKENTRKKQKSYWKIILIGSYLAQDLKNVRHAYDVLIKAMELLFPRLGVGRYTNEEDDIILNEISTNGLQRKTFGILSKRNILSSR